MLAYLTYAEQPSGIYSGQVVDVCRYLSKLQNEPVKLIAFVSIRGFLNTRKTIKKQYPNAIVLPMYPKLKNWKKNKTLLSFILRSNGIKSIICRSAMATCLALDCKSANSKLKTVVYDGRAAEFEQIKEYNVVEGEFLASEMQRSEERAVNGSDFQMAVTEALVEYWKEKYDYKKSSYTVIPCSLNSTYKRSSGKNISRSLLGFSDNNIVLTYSGSVSGWQSFDILFDFFRQQLDSNPEIRILLLTKATPDVIKFEGLYPGKVKQIWCKEDEVSSYLSLCDYGVMLRDPSVTNRVASPVKFAEYLYCGLDIIMNSSIHDYSVFVKQNNCGIVISNNSGIQLKKLSNEKKQLNHQLAVRHLIKDSEILTAKYRHLLDQLAN